MTVPEKVPARLHIFLARDDLQHGLVVRRGPAQQVATIGWDRYTDTFKLGQWFKGRIFEFESDLSPDGKHFLYAARGHKGYQTWTALSKTPYIKALDFSINLGWELGGGLFISQDAYWLHQDRRVVKTQFKTSSYTPLMEHPLAPHLPHWNGLYGCRMQRDGWVLIKERLNAAIFLQKQINPDWLLIKKFYTRASNKIGKSYCYETHQLVNTQTNEVVEYPDWEWADIDQHRVVYAERGKLKAISFTEAKFDPALSKKLYDFNNMVFEEKIAPYKAPVWVNRNK